MMELYWYVLVFVAAFLMVWKPISISVEKNEDLNLSGYFKPKRHYFHEKCSKCGKKLKHYHWFSGKGDKMFCDVDYHGNTTWYCQECDEEIRKDAIYEVPTAERR